MAPANSVSLVFLLGFALANARDAHAINTSNMRPSTNIEDRREEVGNAILYGSRRMDNLRKQIGELSKKITGKAPPFADEEFRKWDPTFRELPQKMETEISALETSKLVRPLTTAASSSGVDSCAGSQRALQQTLSAAVEETGRRRKVFSERFMPAAKAAEKAVAQVERSPVKSQTVQQKVEDLLQNYVREFAKVMKNLNLQERHVSNHALEMLSSFNSDTCGNGASPAKGGRRITNDALPPLRPEHQELGEGL
ncbi:MAG: hypothetical protein EOP11_01960 [Proteobacteria bacterium]|nr:MAG: hypothetical protein EOP11_01960 [Pseudomonadota bacterium]